jgi:succinate-semialdehyde dehydrogenase/glutarate-semialdehyde dehydrogenase
MAGSVSNEAPAFERFVASLKRPDLFESKGLVAAKWVNAPNNATFPVYEPATGRLLKSCSNFTKAEIVEAIESAYEGFSKYFKTTTAKQRGQLIHQWAKLILANKDDCK